MWLPGMPDGALAAGWPSPGAAQAPGGGERAHDKRPRADGAPGDASPGSAPQNHLAHRQRALQAAALPAGDAPAPPPLRRARADRGGPTSRLAAVSGPESGAPDRAGDDAAAAAMLLNLRTDSPKRPAPPAWGAGPGPAEGEGGELLPVSGGGVACGSDLTWTLRHERRRADPRGPTSAAPSPPRSRGLRPSAAARAPPRPRRTTPRSSGASRTQNRKRRGRRRRNWRPTRRPTQPTPRPATPSRGTRRPRPRPPRPRPCVGPRPRPRGPGGRAAPRPARARRTRRQPRAPARPRSPGCAWRCWTAARR